MHFLEGFSSSDLNQRLFDNQVHGVVHGLLMGHRENLWPQAQSLFIKVKEMDGLTASSLTSGTYFSIITHWEKQSIVVGDGALRRGVEALSRNQHGDELEANFRGEGISRS
ncbi:hypothetical protein Bca101_043433 [Brassica carinata]